MADEKLARTLLKYEVDRKSLQDAVASIDLLESRFRGLSKSQDELANSSQKLGSALRGSFSGGVDRSLKRLAELRTEAAKTKGTWDDLRDSLMSGRGRQSGGGANLFRAESLTQSASRALSGLGASGLGDITGQAADILQLRNTLSGALTSITAMEGGIAAAGAGFAAAIGPIVAIGAPLLVLKGILDNLETSAQRSAEAQRAAFEAMKAADDRRLALEKEARTKQREANQQDIKDTEAALQAVSKRREALQQQKRELDAAFAALGSALNPGERSRLGAVGQQLEKDIQATAEEYAKLSKQLGDQVAVLDPLIKKRDEESTAAKRLAEQHDLLAASMRRELELAEQYDQDLIDRRNANFKKSLDAEKQAAKDRADAEDRIIDATRRANTDIENIETRALERRAAIQDQLNKKIVDITRQAAEAAENALTNLKQQREDLTTGLGRDLAAADREAQAKQLDVRIEAQREEARSLREHERNKARILADSRDREFELILNRDFLGLFNLRRQTTGSLQRADSDFSATQQERRIGAGEQLDDLRRQLASERQERLIAYQQQLADAQLAYNREITMVAVQREQALTIARMGRNAELQELQTSTRNALLARRNQAAEEICVAGLVGQARINYLQQERQMLLNQASALRGNTSIGGTRAVATLRDGGGPLRAGQMAYIGVGGEAFNGYALPSPGLFMPTVGGNVTKHNQFNGTWNISGNNPDQIGRVVRGQVEGLLKAYLT